MKTLYLECNMGAAGDMLMAALYELLEDKQGFLDTMNGLGLSGVRLEAQGTSTCGIAGTARRKWSPPLRRPPARPNSTTTGKNITTMTMNTSTIMGMSTATATTITIATTTGRSTTTITTITTTPRRATLVA